MRKISLTILILLAFCHSAYALQTKASQAVLMDTTTGMVLFEKNASQTMYPASMTKIMTAYVVFDQLKSGHIKLNDTFRVSKKAWKKGGSKMFVLVNTDVTVSDLLKGLVIQSGNDAAIALAEGIAGTEDKFADIMNQTAINIGMNSTFYKNATGWPDPQHVTTAFDLAILTKKMIDNFPEYYYLFAEREFTYQKIRQYNRNKLLWSAGGVDGVKTGHTEASGYGIVVSAKREGRRLVSVVNGLRSDAERQNAAEKLLENGFKSFVNYRLAQKGEKVGDLKVWGGATETLPVTVDADFIVSLPKFLKGALNVKLIAKEPIAAPIQKGQDVGEVVFYLDDKTSIKRKAIAAKSVKVLGFFGKIKHNFLNFIGLK